MRTSPAARYALTSRILRAFVVTGLSLTGCAPQTPPPAVPVAAPRAMTLPPPAPETKPVEPTTPPAPVTPRVQRLVRLCRLWGEVRYAHPWVVERAIDWDAALVAALPKVDTAATGADEDAAVEQMLGALGDPVTRVDRTPNSQAVKPGGPSGSFRWEGDGVLVVDMRALGFTEAKKLATALPAEMGKAKALVIDLRVRPEETAELAPIEDVMTAIASSLPSREVAGARTRWIVHYGYRPQKDTTSGGYYSAFETDLPSTWRAATGPRPSRIAFLVNHRSRLPELALPLQRAGDAQIVAEGPVTDEIAIQPRAIDRGERPTALVRVSELDVPFQADLTLPVSAASGADTGLATTLALLKKPVVHPRAAAAPGPAHVASSTVRSAPARLGAAWRPDDVYAANAYPSRELRLLAVFRFWTVIQKFYPYLHLMGDTWDRTLEEFIPRIEAAADAQAYALVIAEMAARIPDSHVNARVAGARAIDAVTGGPDTVPILLQRIGGRPVVTVLRDESARAAGVALGDEVVSVDGEPIDVRTARLGKYIAGSNAWSHALYVDGAALRGPSGSTAVLGLRGADANVREVRVARVANRVQPSTTPAYRLLPEGFGYVDLTRLERDDVDAMFATFADAPGIVFDMRGYPRGTSWKLAPRLARKDGTVAAQFLRNIVGVGGGDMVGSYRFLQSIQPTSLPKYRGKTVMLIDERAISQAEHTGLFLEAANGTRFVGSPTAGANGDTTSTCLPGNVCVAFTGHDVRHADGRQLQRVGLAPDVLVRPTVAGLRAGRDEVLERGVEELKSATAAK